MILKYQNLSDSVLFMMKTRSDKGVTDRTSPLFTENEIELSWPIRHGKVYDEV